MGRLPRAFQNLGKMTDSGFLLVRDSRPLGLFALLLVLAALFRRPSD